MKHFVKIIVLMFVMASCSEKIVRIACIGDSITEGSGLACPAKTAYPVVMDSILGSKYVVLNCGRSATTLQKRGDFPFWICKEFSNVFVYKPNIITIKLGTNDTKPQNWNAARYEADYQSLIDTLKTIKTHPKIYLCLPAPAFKTKWGINDSTVTAGVIPIIKIIASKNNLPVINLYNSLLDQSVNFPDNIHPNEKADKLIGEIIARELKK
jgi:acyl-CoA thioesterase I